MTQTEETQPLFVSMKPSTRLWLNESKKAAIRLMVVLLLKQAAFALVKSTIQTFTVDHLRLSASLVVVVSSITRGSACLLAPLFGWFADRKFGYYPTLVAAIFLSALGAVPLCYAVGDAFTSHESDVTSWRVAYAVGLTCITFGISALRATLIPYTLEQLSDGTESHRTISGLVTVTYLMGMVGELLALIVNHCLVDTGLLDPFWVYLFVPLSLLLAFLLLVIWRRQYRTHSASQLDYTPSLRAILSTGCGCYMSSDPAYYDRKELPIKSAEEEQKDRRDEHRQRLGVIVPILSSLVLFSIFDTQIRQAFVIQASHMDIAQDSERDWLDKQNNLTTQYCTTNTTSRIIVPAEVVRTVCIATVVMMIPIAWCLVPKVHVRWMRRLPTMLERIFIGLLLGVLSCLFATLIEVIRLTAGEIHHICVAKSKYDPIPQLVVYSSVSVLAQIPQQILLGLSSAMVAIAVRDFVLSRAPCEFRCTAYGLIFFVKGLGTYAGMILVLITRRLDCYYDQSINLAEPHANVTTLLDNEAESKAWVYYIIQTILMVACTITFWWVKYKHRDVLRRERDHIHKGRAL